MAGKGRVQGPGRKALRAQLDQTLRAAAKFDQIEPGTGESFCEEVSVAMNAVRQRRIGNRTGERTGGPG